MGRSYYDILQVPVTATAEEIKRAYRKLALLYHPDLRRGNEASSLLFLEIKEAYETLIDPVRRQAYDRQTPAAEPHAGFVYSFHAQVDKKTIACFDELRVSFTYTGEGRFFKRPDFRHFFVTGVPFVAIRKIRLNDWLIKETTLTYIVCPLQAGRLVIDQAAIKIRNQSYFTEPITVDVYENRCFYSSGRPADGKPFRYPMFYETTSGSEKLRLMKNVTHIVLIPRSAYAQTYHRIATALKIAFMIWGVSLCVYIGKSLFIGAVAGLTFGGLMANLLYLIVGVKPLFIHSSRFKTVKEYHQRGYQTGTDTGSSLIPAHWIYHLGHLIL